MNKVAKFFTVSRERFVKDCSEFENAEAIYESLKLPKRATVGSAGYDFYAPFDFELKPNETIKIPTGIRAKIEPGWMLMICPRSGLGFKFRMQLNNTVGIIDSDYFESDNEGHIMVKITNASNEGRVISLKSGEAFAQGLFVPFGITEDDNVTDIRNGGIGSTSHNKEETKR